MKFVSPEPVKDGAQDTIPNTFFWPAISLSKFREDMRTDGTVTPERLRQALLTAMAEVNADLYDFREKQQNRGCADLNSVPAEIVR